MKEYNFRLIEDKWREIWNKSKPYQTNWEGSTKKYILDFFPYPSGSGLHIGHCRNYTISDVLPRYYRMQGLTVLHPMGWDAFGLPAENYAIKTGTPPRESTDKNIASFKKQLHLLGTSYDWDLEIDSSKPEFYRWTQWFFIKLFEKGLAYQKTSPQWWCNSCKTVLANEQVESGKCWRCGQTVGKKELKQWFFKITEYADRLINDLDGLDWPENIKNMQKNWIGKSRGALIKFALKNTSAELEVFTTRIDTIFGVTFMVLAPEHPLVDQITKPERQEEVNKYIELSQSKSEIERLEEHRKKTGVFTGSFAINPITQEEIPIYIADYVLASVGTGAIMAVPAHDLRDLAFAKEFDLTSKEVVDSQGFLVNSDKYTGLNSSVAKEKILADLDLAGLATPKTNYKLRDWLISRQRYWGAPIPIIHCSSCGPTTVPEEQLPVLLPEIQDYLPTGDGQSPLAKSVDFVETTCPKCGQPGKRETDTMDGFACSSWYYLRFIDPHNHQEFCAADKIKQWMPVDCYIGGAEHAVMHLLYARFWYKVMFDLGLVSNLEPFAVLKNQGMILAENGEKMSKSKGNVISPEQIILEEQGADTLRLYELFIAPFDMAVSWDPRAIEGCKRFLVKVWKANPQHYQAKETSVIKDSELDKKTNQIIMRVTDDLEAFKFNTAIAGMMEFANYLSRLHHIGSVSETQYQESYLALIRLLAPFAPFITEEIYESLGFKDSIHSSGNWPQFNSAKTTEDSSIIVVQVNGKRRGEIFVDNQTSPSTIEAQALEMITNKGFYQNQTIKKVIFVPNKIINFVL